MKAKDAPHRIVTDAKYGGGVPFSDGSQFFWVEVAFRSKEEINDLIDARRSLSRSRSEDRHIHIADVDLAPGGPDSSVEIIFSGPQTHRSEEHKRERAKRIKYGEGLLKSGKRELLAKKRRKKKVD